MLSLTPQMKILLAYHPIDFRKGIDSIVSICRNHLQIDPFCGTLFVFRNHKANAVKILVYDGNCQRWTIIGSNIVYIMGFV